MRRECLLGSGLGLVSSLENLVPSGIRAAYPKILYNPSSPDTISLPNAVLPITEIFNMGKIFMKITLK